MDSCLKKDDGRLVFKSTKPHFFKIILDDTIRSRKLGIPRKFVRRYGSELSSPVFLKMPSGAKWEIQLLKCDDEIWLTNGWQEFVEYYSLAFGYFLIFEFEQNCHFNVIIMDKSASEIDYPFSIINGNNKEPDLKEELPEQKIEETENVNPLQSRKTKENSPLPFTQPHKKMKLENPTENTKSHHPTRQSEGLDFAAKRGKAKDTVRTQPLTAEEKATALHRATANFNSGNPYFMIALQPSYLNKLVNMSIPASFAREYFIKNREIATLITKDGKTWSVEFCYTVSNRKQSASLGLGWNKFSQENYLEVGDVCVFELINRSAIRFNVVIFRHIKDTNSSPSLGNNKQLNHEESSICKPFNPGHSCSKAFEAVEAAKKFSSANPFFKVIIGSYHLEQSLLYVPLNIVAKSTTRRRNNAMLQVENKRWPVKLFKYPPNSMIAEGWRSFATENFLKVGDVCIFELIANEAVLLKVTIFRNVD
ncbi:B3 domain-containing transcription factor VRN1 [Manihot esculenta]|uniref:B3 domain-containing transcription factor VRN1 n=1 Tax=Manihot esculenta TaxID=3983 RepID=UPI001CC43358|nr:B3 domain-containing transcription factor VRN1 [Manihot esculenta]